MEFCGFQTSLLRIGPLQSRKELTGSEIDCGALIRVDSGMPLLIAADSTNALKVDPAWKPLESPYFWGTT